MLRFFANPRWITCFICAALPLLVAYSSQAQPHWLVQAGTSANHFYRYGTEVKSHIRSGYEAGVIAAFPLVESLTLNTGLRYTTRAGTLSYEGLLGGSSVRRVAKTEIRYRFLEIPLALDWRFARRDKVECWAGGGLSYSFLTRVTTAFDIRDSSDNGVHHMQSKPFRHRVGLAQTAASSPHSYLFNVAFRAQIGVVFSRRWMLQTYYNRMLYSISAQPGTQMRLQSVGVTAGVLIRRRDRR